MRTSTSGCLKPGHTQNWILERGIFEERNPITRDYGEAVAGQAAE
jgi:hypothetical protein